MKFKTNLMSLFYLRSDNVKEFFSTSFSSFMTQTKSFTSHQVHIPLNKKGLLNIKTIISFRRLRTYSCMVVLHYIFGNAILTAFYLINHIQSYVLILTLSSFFTALLLPSSCFWIHMLFVHNLKLG